MRLSVSGGGPSLSTENKMCGRRQKAQTESFFGGQNFLDFRLNLRVQIGFARYGLDSSWRRKLAQILFALANAWADFNIALFAYRQDAPAVARVEVAAGQ